MQRTRVRNCSRARKPNHGNPFPSLNHFARHVATGEETYANRRALNVFVGRDGLSASAVSHPYPRIRSNPSTDSRPPRQTAQAHLGRGAGSLPPCRWPRRTRHAQRFQCTGRQPQGCTPPPRRRATFWSRRSKAPRCRCVASGETCRAPLPCPPTQNPHPAQGHSFKYLSLSLASLTKYNHYCKHSPSRHVRGEAHSAGA